MNGRRMLAAFGLLVLTALPAQAIDYRSIAVPAAVLYDAPSQKGKKLYLIRAQTPVEVVVRLEGWFKVRDAEGTLAWIESAQVTEQRTLVVVAERGEVRQADRAEAPLVIELNKSVAVDLIEPAAPGWVKVRHRDGEVGYIRATQVWGL